MKNNIDKIYDLEIIRYADIVLAFWDGKSHGTRFVIENCKKEKIPPQCGGNVTK